MVVRAVRNFPPVLALLLPLLSASAHGQQAPLTFGTENVGGLRSDLAGELALPPGAGPFPAVILLHGCDGVSPHIRNWARRLVDWGYAAFIIDSFKPRGADNICNNPTAVPAVLRARDAWAAVRYLNGLASIDSERIGAIGFSHGAGSALYLAPQARVEEAKQRAFAAIVAFYPECRSKGVPLATDILILTGGADDWTPAQSCLEAAAKYDASAPHRPIVKVYPGATHSFDARRPERTYAGHRLAFDPAAAEDAIALTRQFLVERLHP